MRSWKIRMFLKLWWHLLLFGKFSPSKLSHINRNQRNLEFCIGVKDLPTRRFRNRFKLVMQVLHVDQQKAAWFGSNFCVLCFFFRYTFDKREWGVLHNTSIYSACIGLTDSIYPVAAIHERALMTSSEKTFNGLIFSHLHLICHKKILFWNSQLFPLCH